MYHMTVYDTNGDVLFNESLAAKTDDEAKTLGNEWLTKQGYASKPHRIFHSTGRLVSFYPHKFQVK